MAETWKRTRPGATRVRCVTVFAVVVMLNFAPPRSQSGMVVYKTLNHALIGTRCRGDVTGAGRCAYQQEDLGH